MRKSLERRSTFKRKKNLLSTKNRREMFKNKRLNRFSVNPFYHTVDQFWQIYWKIWKGKKQNIKKGIKVGPHNDIPYKHIYTSYTRNIIIYYTITTIYLTYENAQPCITHLVASFIVKRKEKYSKYHFTKTKRSNFCFSN